MKKIFLLLLFILILISCKENKPKLVKDAAYENKIDALISKMTLEEKIGQTNLRGVSSRAKILPEDLKESVKKGNVGAFLNIMNIDYVDELQKLARIKPTRKGFDDWKDNSLSAKLRNGVYGS